MQIYNEEVTIPSKRGRSNRFMRQRVLLYVATIIIGLWCSATAAGGLLSENLAEWPVNICLLYTSPSPRDAHESRMPSSA